MYIDSTMPMYGANDAIGARQHDMDMCNDV